MENFEGIPQNEVEKERWEIRREIGRIVYQIELLTGKSLRSPILGLGEHQAKEFVEMAEQILQNEGLWDTIPEAGHHPMVDEFSRKQMQDNLAKLVARHEELESN